MASVATSTSSPSLSGDAATDPRVRWRPSVGGTAARIGVFALLAAAALAIPRTIIPEPIVNVYTLAMVYGIVALSMNVLIGYTGQVSLGHHAFVGVGAFTSGYMLDRMQLPWLIAVLGAVVVGAVISLALGAVALRVKGLYFALVTIAYGLFIERTVFNITAITGGGAGMPAPRPGFAQSDVVYGYLTLGFLLLVWLLDWRLTSSRGGRAIQALRDDERVAASWGINVKAYKLLAFMISGGMAGLAGALFASRQQIVSPQTFAFGLGLTFVLMTVVGGIRSRPGVVIGGFVFATLPTLLKQVHEAWGVPDANPHFDSLPPKIVQALLLLAVVGIIVERIVHAFRHGRLAGRIAAVVVGGPLALIFLLMAPAGFTSMPILGEVNIWKGINDQIEPLIGAGLLLLTLTQFPGGIAQQFDPVFRWLSFKPLKAPSSATVGGGAAGGGMGARP